VEVEDQGDQGNSQDQAGGYAPPQLVPHGIERYLLAKALALHIPAKKIIRYDRE
jgi:hypothetical protein